METDKNILHNLTVTPWGWQDFAKFIWQVVYIQYIPILFVCIKPSRGNAGKP